MPRHELLDDARDDVVDREGAFTTAELRLEDDLEEQIPELLAELGAVARIDRVDDLAGLFQRVFAQGLERLFAVPRATVRREQPPHDGDEPGQGRTVLLLERRHGPGLVFVESFQGHGRGRA